jgi:hypothetical protein
MPASTISAPADPHAAHAVSLRPLAPVIRSLQRPITQIAVRLI